MHSIRLRLIVLFMVVTTIALGSVAFYEQQLHAAQQETHFKNLQADVVSRLQLSLADPLWALDLKLVEAKLEAELQSQEISAVVVTTADGVELYAGIARDAAGVPQVVSAPVKAIGPTATAAIFPPSQIDDDRRIISIGTVTIHFSLTKMDADLHAALVRRIAEVVVMALLLMAVLALSLQIIFRPLHRLGDALHQLASSRGDHVEELALTQRLELDEVIGGFNLTLGKLKQIIHMRTEAETMAREATAATAQALSQMKAAQLELIQKNKQLEELAVTDTLTRLCNRLKLDQVLASEHERSLRYGNGFALVLLDVDHFKVINDTHGHPVGDQVLIELARLLMAGTRSVDRVGRWGGEEFLIICPDTDLRGAIDFAEKMRQDIAKHHFPVVGQITASFGVTITRPGDSIQQLIARTDTALYRSKNNGRNRVESNA